MKIKRTAQLLSVLLCTFAVTAGFSLPAAHATFPGNNGLIVFVSNRDGDPEIFTMTSAGASVTQLTHNTVADQDPRWSADGTKITWEQAVGGHNEIFTMNANGTNQLQRTSFGADSWAPGWAPNGKRIVFVSNKAGQYDLYTMKANGSDVRRVAKLAGDEEWPSISPSGTKILFDSDASGAYQEWIVNVDGTHAHRLTTDPNNVESSWSPNGKLITFESSRPNDTGHFQLYKMKADGSGQTILLTDSAHSYYGPSYSPSQTKIVYYSAASGNDEIYVMNSNGSGITNITNDASADSDPNWQAI